MQYYFLASALPDLQLGVPPPITFQDMDLVLQWNLSKNDYIKFLVLRRYFDIQNLRSFWKRQVLDPKGVFHEQELEEAIFSEVGFPEYVYGFLSKYGSNEARLSHFPELLTLYFKEEIKMACGFLLKFLRFERDIRLVLTALRAKTYGKDVVKEIQYEDPQDDLVFWILAQKDAASFEPPPKYKAIKGIFEDHKDMPLDLFQAFYSYRFYKMDEFFGLAVFSLDRILAYVAQLIIVEIWLELDKKKGLNLVDTMVKGA